MHCPIPSCPAGSSSSATRTTGQSRHLPAPRPDSVRLPRRGPPPWPCWTSTTRSATAPPCCSIFDLLRTFPAASRAVVPSPLVQELHEERSSSSSPQEAAAPERSSPCRHPLPVPSSTPASPPSTLQCPQPPPFPNRKRSLALLQCRPSSTPPWMPGTHPCASSLRRVISRTRARSGGELPIQSPSPPRCLRARPRHRLPRRRTSTPRAPLPALPLSVSFPGFSPLYLTPRSLPVPGTGVHLQPRRRQGEAPLPERCRRWPPPSGMPWTPALQELRPFLCLAAVALFCDEHRAPPCFFCKASSTEPKNILAPLEPSPL